MEQTENTRCQVTRVDKKCLVMQYCASLIDGSLLYLHSFAVLVPVTKAVLVHLNIPLFPIRYGF
jgi:hypothetical protein